MTASTPESILSPRHTRNPGSNWLHDGSQRAPRTSSPPLLQASVPGRSPLLSNPAKHMFSLAAWVRI